MPRCERRALTDLVEGLAVLVDGTAARTREVRLMVQVVRVLAGHRVRRVPVSAADERDQSETPAFTRRGTKHTNERTVGLVRKNSNAVPTAVIRARACVCVCVCVSERA